jgi:regulator of replication initiation timing
VAGATPDIGIRLREQIAKLNKTVANKDKELTQLRSDVPALVRVINQITAENTELREALNTSPANVVPVHRRAGSSAE